jgi:hypothetical protein
VATAPVHETRERESCRERSRPDEPSIAAIEEASIRRGALIAAPVVLVGLAVNMVFAAIIDVVVDKLGLFHATRRRFGVRPLAAGRAERVRPRA